MKQEERVIAGLEEPQAGFKVEEGKIVPMTMTEQIAVGQMTQEVYEERMEAENTAELQRRLTELQTPEALCNGGN